MKDNSTLQWCGNGTHPQSKVCYHGYHGIMGYSFALCMRTLRWLVAPFCCYFDACTKIRGIAGMELNYYYNYTSIIWTPLGQFGVCPSVLIREVPSFQR